MHIKCKNTGTERLLCLNDCMYGSKLFKEVTCTRHTVQYPPMLLTDITLITYSYLQNTSFRATGSALYI